MSLWVTIMHEALSSYILDGGSLEWAVVEANGLFVLSS